MHYYMHYVGLTLCLLLVLELDKSQAQTYKAAVVAYKPSRDPNDFPNEIRIRNKDGYKRQMDNLKDLVDIVVFPENGLTTIEPNSKYREHLDSYSIAVPDSGNPCTMDSGKYDVLVGLSCGAKTNGLFVVCNVVEKSGEGPERKYYSTNVVFDADGALILKCRKKYPYSNTNFNSGDPDQQCVFNAKFKNNNEVKFAILFDTDMLNQTKTATSNVILTSSFQNKLPLSYALSVQLGYSVKNKVNLLASGYSDARKGYGGSGIYFRNGTSLVTASDATVIQAEIPINDDEEVKVDVKPYGLSSTFHNLTYERIPTLVDTNSTVQYSFNSSDNFCNFKTNLNSIQPYKWAAFNGELNYLGRNVSHLVVCALIKPKEQRNEDKRINSLSISTTLSSDNIIQIIPISLRSDGLPAKFEFGEKVEGASKKTTISTTEEANLSAFGIVVVLKHAIPSSSPSSSSSIHALHICTVWFVPMILVFCSKKFIFSI